MNKFYFNEKKDLNEFYKKELFLLISLFLSVSINIFFSINYILKYIEIKSFEKNIKIITEQNLALQSECSVLNDKIKIITDKNLALKSKM